MFPHTIREINELPDAQKWDIYITLIPDWIYQRFNIDRETLTVKGEPVVEIVALKGSRSFEISVYHEMDAAEPSLYAHLADNTMGQLMVMMVVMSDPEAPRFYIDRMPDGEQTYFGTAKRNIPEEIRAMKAGLAPGQVRAGLRGFRRAVPFFEEFVRKMQHDLFLIEPLSYHNAVVFERYGFGYMHGKSEMQWIHEAFQPGGELHEKLHGSTPFRPREAWKSIRGRSWAIHDGIMGHAFTGFHMYKRIGKSANINTFPDAIW